jgi:aryl-alcohol dehydrogenase-like predicted oxidoreductase
MAITEPSKLNTFEGLHLGLGTLSIGRAWGTKQSPVPDHDDAMALLQTAIDSGIRVFDTAPAYGASEQRLGVFLEKQSQKYRSEITILTKMGEDWNEQNSQSFVDHRRDAMCRTIDRSLRRLGSIEMLQLHKATEDVIAAPDTLSALVYARTLGITTFGASVSSVEAAQKAIDTGLYAALQFPLNIGSTAFETLLPLLGEKHILPIINRPFAMGKIVQSDQDKNVQGRAAFRFLKDRIARGIILSGTGQPKHLQENIEMFALA